MMKGYLAMKGVHAAETRIGSVLRTMHQPYNEARRQVGYTINVKFKMIQVAACNLTYLLPHNHHNDKHMHLLSTKLLRNQFMD